MHASSQYRHSVLPALLIAAALALAVPISAQQDTNSAFTTEDALGVASLRVHDATDDGRYLIATRYTSRDSKNVDHMRFGDPTYISPSYAELLLIDTDSKRETAVFEAKVQVQSPVFSPDGSTVAFLLRRGDEYFLHTFDRERNRVREVRLRSDKPIASNSPILWHPDGSRVLLALRDTAWARESRRMYLELTDGPVIVQDSRDSFLAWETVRNQNSLVIPAIVDVQSREVVELLPVSRVSDQEFSEDGDFVTYVESTPIKTSYQRNKGTEYQLFMLGLDSLEPRPLSERSEDRLRPNWNDKRDAFAYAEKGNVFVRSVYADSAENVTEQHRVPLSEEDTTKIRFSVERWRPDDAALLLSSQRGYHVLDIGSDEMQLVYERDEDDENAPRVDPTWWSPDGRYIYMTYSARDKWERGIVRLDVGTRQVEDLVKDSNLYSRWSFSKDGNRVFFERSDGDLPGDLYMADASLARIEQVTDLNPWMRDRKLTRSELVEWLNVDGKKMYGILYYPVDYDPSRKYPLVAEIYEQFFDNGFNHRMNLLANAGFFGFRPSVEFETGYPGEAWLKSVTTGINAVIDRGLVDPDKLGVHGTSYGGYATNLLITQTDRFAAAINISGKVNIISFLGDSPKITTRNYNAAEEGQDRIGATLWEQPNKYIAHSAVMFADRIDTPLLLMTGEGDWNVPTDNEREMYYALRRLDKEVVWVHYMNAGHGAGRSSTVEDFHDHWERIIDWYTTHFEKAEEDKQ